MLKKINLLLVLLLIFAVIPINAGAYTKPDEISFSDFGGIVSDGVKDYVKEKNELLFSHAKAKIIFVTTDTTNGLSAGEYAKSLYASWGVGSLGRGNSVFIVIATNTNDYGVVQGKNIKRVLTDSVLYKFIADDFEPYFAKGDYNKAVMTLYNTIAGWYEENYNGLNLGLDDNIGKYVTTEITRDINRDINQIVLWVGVGIGIIFVMVFFKIKRNADFKARQKERKIKRKRDKANIDKIVNS